MASEILRARRSIAAVEGRLEELLSERPEARIVRSMPAGMGAVFTAEFLAEIGDLSRFASADYSLAAAAGLVPVTRASGNASFQRRARRDNRPLKHLMFWSAFRCVARHKPSTRTSTSASEGRARPTTRPPSRWRARGSTSCGRCSGMASPTAKDPPGWLD
jgi:transposase